MEERAMKKGAGESDETYRTLREAGARKLHEAIDLFTRAR
jgi:hypothetical protein